MSVLDFSASTLEQQSVILTTEQPLLVIAGPGAGKTKTLVDRVIHLVADLGIPSSSILVATFTEKAAKELVSRISSLAHELGVTINISDMYIGTLHSIFLNILEEYRAHTTLKRNYRVLDDFEKQYLIFQNSERFNKIENLDALVSGHFGWNFAKEIASLVSRQSEENLNLEKLFGCTESRTLPVLAALTKEYRELLSERNALDFSLIQTMMWELLKDDFVLNDLRRKIQYLMIDEYQDTNRIQEQILLQIATPKNKICVVGDDDQALYRFRGATVENILRFQENFSKGECKKIELNRNFRSHKDIISFYNKYMKSPWLAEDKDGGSGDWQGENGEVFRYDKTILHAKNTTEEQENYPGVVRVMGDAKVETWCKEVLDFISVLRQKNILKNYNQIAVLSYSVKNDNTRFLAQYLEEHGIPTFSPRSDMFFERKEIRLAVGFYMFIFPNLIEEVLKPDSSHRKQDDIYSYYEDCARFFGDEIRKEREKHKSLLIFATQKFKELNNLTHNTDYAFADLFY
ncbi:MAG: UvrD-helicase domain-containing protein [Spirochaetales bacterium]|nr:UvrD-helicase domain-containing protein [Spirochaetales bacterium]